MQLEQRRTNYERVKDFGNLISYLLEMDLKQVDHLVYVDTVIPNAHLVDKENKEMLTTASIVKKRHS